MAEAAAPGGRAAALPSRALFRALTPYTIGLWVVGYAWLLLVMSSLDRFYQGRAVLALLPIIAFTTALALAIQGLFVIARDWPAPARVPVIAAVTLAAALGTSWVDLALDHLMAVAFFPEMLGWAQVDLEGWTRGTFLYGWVFGFNVAVMMLRLAIEEARLHARRLGDALDAAQTARLTMLRYQLNPHFLFNSLNALSGLVLTRQNARAEEMIERLATFLRASAAFDPAALVPLHEELATIGDYLEVESVRFGDRLGVDYRIAPGAGDLAVPGFLLQPIVENAIKHGVAPAGGPVTITIAARSEPGGLVLEVSDDGRATGPVKGGTGIGLANVRARLATFFGDRARLEAGRTDGGYRVRIDLPARAAA